MALTNNGTIVGTGISDDQLPSGYTRPSGVTTFTDEQWVYRLELSVLKSTVENSTPSTTMGNIISNGTIGVTKQITDIVAADFVTAPTTTFYTEILTLKTTQSDISGSNDVWLDDIAQSYLVGVIVKLKN